MMPVAFYNIILCGHIIFGMEAPPRLRPPAYDRTCQAAYPGSSLARTAAAALSHNARAAVVESPAVLDHRGLEFPNFRAARDEANRTRGEMLRQIPSAINNGDPFQLWVTDGVRASRDSSRSSPRDEDNRLDAPRCDSRCDEEGGRYGVQGSKEVG
jgi:hypothetical protein